MSMSMLLEKSKEYIDLFRSLIETQIKPNFNSQTILKISVGSLLGFTIAYGVKIWYSHRYFARRGIKTPKYNFIGGNQAEIFKKTYSEVVQKWTSIYGKTYGYYEGNTPVLITSDLEMIEEIFYKQFANFTGRKNLPFTASDKGKNVNMFMCQGNQWKRMRSIINPTFAPARLRELTTEMKKCIDRLSSLIERNLDKEVDISEFFDRMVMDVVWNCGYGIDIDFQSNPTYPFFVRSQRYFQYIANHHITIYKYRKQVYFPELKPYMLNVIWWYTYYAKKINSNLGNPFYWIVQEIHDVLVRRLKTNVHRKDYTQILVNAQSDNFVPIDGNADQKYDPELVEKKLTYNELIMNLMMFLNGGFETTSVTLSIFAYVLAKYPEEMAKLQAEIDSIESDSFDYDSVSKLEYLDLFIKELQRMYPISLFSVGRKCTNATKVCGIEMEKGFIVAVDVLSLHYDPQYWVEPKVFNPKRFSSENKINKLVYMPFGAGPRSCIGFRFALLEIKLTIAHLLKKYDICAPSSGLVKELKYKEGIVKRPTQGIKVMLKKRVGKE